MYNTVELKLKQAPTHSTCHVETTCQCHHSHCPQEALPRQGGDISSSQTGPRALPLPNCAPPGGSRDLLCWEPRAPGCKAENQHQSPRQIKLSEFFLEVKWRLLSRTGSGQTRWKRPPRSKASKKGRTLAPSLGAPLPGAGSVGGRGHRTGHPNSPAAHPAEHSQ